jgi:hypothetical protein
MEARHTRLHNPIFLRLAFPRPVPLAALTKSDGVGLPVAFEDVALLR